MFINRIRIFDDDIDLKNIEPKGSDDELYFGTKEEKPVIAQIIDERPLHMRRKDIDRNQWRTVGYVGEEDDHKNEKTTKTEKDSTLNSRHKERQSERDLSPPRSERSISQTKRKRHDSDSDLSPERPSKGGDCSRDRSKTKSHYEKDLSPPRHRLPKTESNSKRHDSDSDLSPPRILKTANDPTEDKKRELTLGGKKAGLSEAKHLREELMATKKREQKMFESISDEMLGKNAKTVFRDSKSGKIRDLEEEARLQHQKDLIKDKIESERKAKYQKWSKGLVQTQQRKEKIESDLHEMSKPLARYEGDEDLDQMLREKGTRRRPNA